MKVLITGTHSGLGKHLLEEIGGIAYNRDNPQTDSVDIIIHCAFNSSKQVDKNNLDSYINDNAFLTGKLLNIPHKKFIFISSVDVYLKNNKRHTEDEVIDAGRIEDVYGYAKLISENLIKSKSPNFLILRCTAMLGKYSRKNSLIRIIEENILTLTLSSESVFNYILHKDVSEFIKIALEKNLGGIYNLASAKNITLQEVALIFKKKVKFGNFIYNVGNIDNKKAALILSNFKKTSEETIREFIE